MHYNKGKGYQYFAEKNLLFIIKDIFNVILFLNNKIESLTKLTT